MLLCALSAWHADHTQIVIAAASRAEQRELLSELGKIYLPFAVVIPLTTGPDQERLARRLPFVAAMSPRDGRPAAYVCRDFACREPVTTAEDLRHELRG